jgi:hypothetical protein
MKKFRWWEIETSGIKYRVDDRDDIRYVITQIGYDFIGEGINKKIEGYTRKILVKYVIDFPKFLDNVIKEN